MTEKTPGDRQDAKPLDGSPEKDGTPTPATPSEGAPREEILISFDDLFWRADSDRIGAEAWCTICERRAQDALAIGDAQSADVYRVAWRGHRRRAAEYERLQVLLCRMAKSAVIKNELARMARLEKAGVDENVAGDVGVAECD